MARITLYYAGINSYVCYSIFQASTCSSKRKSLMQEDLDSLYLHVDMEFRLGAQEIQKKDGQSSAVKSSFWPRYSKTSSRSQSVRVVRIVDTTWAGDMEPERNTPTNGWGGVSEPF